MKTIIIHQEDYSETRQVKCIGTKALEDLPSAKTDSFYATKMALGFGIEKDNILHYTNMSKTETLLGLRTMQRVIKAYTSKGKKVFLFVYCAGHGLKNNDS